MRLRQGCCILRAIHCAPLSKHMRGDYILMKELGLGLSSPESSIHWMAQPQNLLVRNQKVPSRFTSGLWTDAHRAVLHSCNPKDLYELCSRYSFFLLPSMAPRHSVLFHLKRGNFTQMPAIQCLVGGVSGLYPNPPPVLPTNVHLSSRCLFRQHLHASPELPAPKASPHAMPIVGARRGGEVGRAHEVRINCLEGHNLLEAWGDSWRLFPTLATPDAASRPLRTASPRGLRISPPHGGYGHDDARFLAARTAGRIRGRQLPRPPNPPHKNRRADGADGERGERRSEEPRPPTGCQTTEEGHPRQ